jgi:hypothetical protein
VARSEAVDEPRQRVEIARSVDLTGILIEHVTPGSALARCGSGS